MSNRFHNKWHRASHHSYKDPTIIDAGWDPIASPDNPFQGDFVLADGSGGTQIGELYTKTIHTTKLTPESPEGQDWNADKIVVDTNLKVTGNITGDGDLYVSGNTSGKGWLKIDKYGDFGEYVHIHGQNNDGYGLIVDKKAYVSGETVLNDKTYVNKNGLFVTGDSIFNDDLNVSGNETIGEYVHILGAYPTTTETYGGCGLVVDKKAYVSGETILNDKTYINQNGLFVTGDSKFADDLTIDKNLYVTGNTMSAFIKSAKIEYADITSADIEKIDIHVGEKDGYILSGGLTGDDKTKVPESYVGGVQNLYLSGEGLISDSYVLFNGETRLTDVLNVSGETKINNKLTIQRYGADITGAVVLHNSLSVSGKSHFKDEAEFLDDVKVSGDAFVNGVLNVTGDSTFVDTYTTGTANINTLSVTGNSDLDGNLDVGGTLTVTGATTLGSTLGVTGATTLNNTLNVSGKTTVSNEIVAASSITTNKNLYVSGGANISNFGKFGGYVYVSGADDDGYGLVVEKKANIKGDIIIGGDLDVTGDSTFVNTYITGDATINNLSVTGNATAQTQPSGTRTTQIATTEFVQQEISNLPDPYRIVSRNGRTEVVSNQDGTASIIDNESGQKGINVPEGFDFTGITPIESGDISLVGPYEIQGRWYWLPSTVDPETFDPSSTVDIHVVLGGVTSDEPNYVIVGFLAAYNITGWNTDSATLTRTQSEQAYQHGDITVCDIASEKTVATTDQIPTDIVSHQELDDALFNKVSQNAQFRMSIKDDGKVVVSGCRYRSANSTTQPFSNTYCVVSSENSLFDGGGGKIDFKIFNSTNGELLYRAVGYATGNWTVLQNNLTSEAASYLPNVGGNIQFPIIITTNPENKVLEVYLTGSGRVLQPWSNFTSWADSKTKTLATLQNIAPDFSMDSTYEVGDYVTYDGSLWKCKVAVTTAGQWTESDNWEQFIVMDEINSKIGDINSVLDAINGEEI